jgi:uncharacterized protein DUF4259
MQLLQHALRVRSAEDYVDLSEGARAVAAAQVVSWLVVPTAVEQSPNNERATGWVRSIGAPANPSLIDAARAALGRVRSEGSELAELWADSGDDGWPGTLDRIEQPLVSGS